MRVTPTTIWNAVVIALAILVAAVPLLLFDAGANNGSGPMTALFGIPMVATAALIQITITPESDRPVVRRVAPWVGALAAGMLFLAIAAVLTDLRYYAAETQGGMFATLAGMTFIIIFGAACGIVVWFAVALPIASLLLAARQQWRGEPTARHTVIVPATVLGLEVAGVLAIIVFGGVELDRLVVVQIVSALFGVLPEWYLVGPEIVLWIIRGLIVAVVVVGAILTLVRAGGREKAPTL